MPLQYLATSSLAECHPESPDGVKAVGAYGLLARLAADEISPAAVDFLAEPVERPGEVQWHTQLEGEVVPFERLDGKDRDSALDALCTMAARYQALADSLEAAPAASRKTAGKVVRRVAAAAAAAAVSARGPCLFMVGGLPVLAGWGLSTSLGGLASQILCGERPPIPDFRAVPPPPPEEPQEYYPQPEPQEFYPPEEPQEYFPPPEPQEYYPQPEPEPWQPVLPPCRRPRSGRALWPGSSGSWDRFSSSCSSSPSSTAWSRG